VYSTSDGERDTVHLGGSQLNFDADAHGARGDLTITWEGGDNIEAKFELPGFNALRPDTTNQPIEGRIRAHASDLAMLSAYLPGLDHTRGDLTADLTLAGTLRQPDLSGEVRLRDGRATIPALGV